MPPGGARVRSGPPVDPNSGRSERRGLKFASLPAAGYEGEIPTFPLPNVTEREQQVWEESWRLPQGAAWAAEAWRHRTVALWVRLSVRCEDSEASASLFGQAKSLAEQIGLSADGLKRNGWQIAPAAPAVHAVPAPEATVTPLPRRRRDA